MILAVTGGRTYCEVVEDVDEAVEAAMAQRRALSAALNRANDHRRIERLVHGAARGADRWSGIWAQVNGVRETAYPVQIAIDGPWPGAGPNRNQRVLDSEPDIAGLVVFPGGSGTADMMRRARARGIRIWEPYGLHGKQLAFKGMEDVSGR